MAEVTTPPLLSDRQLEVVRLFADGLDGPQIADRLGITHQAVYARLARAARALGTHTATQTTVECERRGWLTTEEVIS
ncbi:MAG TPA: LuxR C-terminal-related transcriptional regulator [Actinophytocola sp.]|uniref:LuxR C-terminal-related transcriptional regulator n=1 Tax=Actinophytocola sp. TaxID=1872138 RepID=UPI002DDD9DB0|nr:LuxR C-terminal-related transcriptional regulator [Actinophytocola sp.]HEV2778570.1 LuxR C-terminal-related transcriptional regulator [Actinophytocola sp.]